MRQSKLSLAITKSFNYALREMKSGALCAIVDASHQVFILIYLNNFCSILKLYAPVFIPQQQIEIILHHEHL